MNTINKALISFMMLVMMASSLTLFVVTFIQVVSRFVLKLPIPWAPDVTRLCFIYAIFFGAAYAACRNEHLCLDVILNCLSPRVRSAVQAVLYLVVSAFLIFVTWRGYIFVSSIYAQKFPYLNLSMSYMYAAVPVGTAIMAFFYPQHAWRGLKELFARQEGEGV